MSTSDGLAIALGTESLRCLPQHALWWPAQRTLFIADVHLGKAASFRAAGVALPSGHSSHDLDRISTLLSRFEIARLVILGDLVHARTSYTDALNCNFRVFRTRHHTVDMVLVRGNHDRHAGEAPIEWRLRVVAEPFTLGPFACCHEPDVSASHAGSGIELCGHLHPALRVQTAREGITLPCFWLRQQGLVLPAFGSLTGKYVVQLQAHESAIVVAGQHLHHISHRR